MVVSSLLIMYYVVFCVVFYRKVEIVIVPVNFRETSLTIKTIHKMAKKAGTEKKVCNTNSLLNSEPFGVNPKGRKLSMRRARKKNCVQLICVFTA